MAADAVDKIIIEVTDITDLKRREEEIESTAFLNTKSST